MGFTSIELHRIPTNQTSRPQNRITVNLVISKVMIQHLLQISIAFILAILTRPDDISIRKIESFWIVICKIWIAAIIMDTYQVN